MKAQEAFSENISILPEHRRQPSALCRALENCADVREHEDGYEVDIELPGFHKEDIRLSIENGYLNITAEKGLDKEQTDRKSGKIIRQERYAGSLSRSFFVGEELTEEDIKAKLEHGILSIRIPKKEVQKALPEKKFIAIEG